jgi:RNA polymerase sigma-70 factor (ECF subfamily)
MPDTSPTGDSFFLASYRAYLRSLAFSQLDPGHWAKAGVSGVVQEALLNAYRARDQFQGQTEQDVAAWLRTIFNDVLANAMRTSSTKKIDASRMLSEVLASCSMQAEGLPENRQLPAEATVAHNEQLLALAAALAGPPDDERAVVEMKHLHGLSLAEICEQTGRSKPWVVGILYRGMKALRVLLNDSRNRNAGDRP